MTSRGTPGVLASSDCAGDRVAQEQGQGARNGSRDGGGAGVAEMRLLCEAERGVHLHKGESNLLVISSADDKLGGACTFLWALPRAENPVCYWRWRPNTEEEGKGGPSGGFLQKGQDCPRPGAGDGVGSPAGVVGGGRRNQLASATDVAICGGGLSPNPEDGRGDGEGGGPEGAGGSAGGGRLTLGGLE